MDEETLRRLITEHDGVEFAPTAEMMMMNSAAANDNDASDLDLPGFLIQQPRPQETTVRANQPVVTSTRAYKGSGGDGDDDDLLLEDETFLERIIALREMFPEALQNAVGALNRMTIEATKLAFNKGRTASWWLTSTMCVLVFPILIQKELLQVAEQISREQRSILLGPQAATGAISGAAF